MHKKFKVIREEVKRVVVQHRADDDDNNPATKSSNDRSKVKDASFDKGEKKRFQTNLAGKQKEPNRGEGASRTPSVAKPHRTGPTNEEVVAEAKSTHTHKGHCQACGRQQAVINGSNEMAKHGYKVEGDHHFGQRWFRGTCFGSGHQPLEKDHKLTSEVITSMNQEHKKNMQHAADLRSGKLKPTHVTTNEHERDEKGNVKRDPVTGGRIYKKIPFKEANKYQQQETVTRHAFNHEHIAKQAKDHAAYLKNLKTQIHGKPLIPNAALTKPKPMHVDVVPGLKFKTEHGEYEVHKFAGHFGMGGSPHYWVKDHAGNPTKYRFSHRDIVKHVRKMNESINEKAESTRFHPTHKLISNSGSEVKMGSAVRGHGGTTHIVDRLEPSKFGGAADTVITHSTDNPALRGSFHPSDIGTKMVKRTVKEGRESEFRANKELALKKDEKKSGTNAYHNWVAKKTAKKPVKEDIAMAAGAAGDPGHVQNPNDNYAAQKARGIKVKSLMRRKKPNVNQS